jgi:tetratricopeptide (TPR) repeat protein
MPGSDSRGYTPNTKRHRALAALGRYQQAIECYDRALAIEPAYAPVWNNKAASLSALGRYQEAIQCWDRALGIDPRHANAWYGRANAAEKLGRRNEAVKSYRRFVEVATCQHGAEVGWARQRIRELEAG